MFHALDFNHTVTVTSSPMHEPAVLTPTPTLQPEPQPLPKIIKTIRGTSSNNKLTGTTGNDRIEGKNGNDLLWGKAGSDILVGGSGKDAFIFDIRLSARTADIILDFNVKDDTIRLNDTIFTKLKTGVLLSSNFVVGDRAVKAKDYIIYNTKTGALLYDADGSGSAAAIQFAQVSAKLKLTAAAFLVI